LRLRGVDTDGCPYTLFPKMKVTLPGETKPIKMVKEPYMVPIKK